MEISAVFAPPKAPRTAKGYVATASEAEADENFGREAHAAQYAIEVLETGQKVTLGLKGEALAPRVSPSRSALGFGECAQYERAELPLTLTNHAPLPVSVSFGRAANFSVAPATLTLPASGTSTATVTFEPHQLGPIKASVQMSFFDDRVGSQALHLSGHCSAPARRAPAGGVGKLPEHFDAERTARLVQAGQLGGTRAFSRLPAWQTVHGVTAQGLSVVDSLRKRKTFESQQALQPHLDAIDRMDTGLELSADELQGKEEHRRYYDGYLATQREQRQAAQQLRHVSRPAVEDFCLGLDIGLDAASGLRLPLPELPKGRMPLWLERPYEEEGSGEGASKSTMAIFDATRLFPRKFKPRPEAAEELRECKLPLSPKELLMVTGGPKTIDFGTVSVFTSVARNFTVMNELRSICLVAVEALEEEELAQSTPASQVIPAGVSAGFDIIFCSNEPVSFRRTINYVINGLHTFKFTATAEVVPTEVQLSTEELLFRFDDGNLDPSVTKTLTLTNPGTFPAHFTWEHPQGLKGKPAFLPHPMSGEVAPRKSLQVQVTFTPYLGAQSEHALTLQIRGGASRTLVCKADVREVTLTSG